MDKPDIVERLGKVYNCLAPGAAIESADLDGMAFTVEEAAAEITRLRAQLAAARELIDKFIPKNICLTNARWSDDTVVPLETTMGELRTLAALKETDNG